MIHLCSFLWSITYPFTVLAGQAAGYLLGVALYFIYDNIMFLNLPAWLVEVGPTLVAGLVAGWLAGSVITKYARQTNFVALVVLPVFLTAVALVGSVIGYTEDRDLTAALAESGSMLIALAVFVSAVRGHKGSVGDT